MYYTINVTIIELNSYAVKASFFDNLKPNNCAFIHKLLFISSIHFFLLYIFLVNTNNILNMKIFIRGFELYVVSHRLS